MSNAINKNAGLTPLDEVDASVVTSTFGYLMRRMHERSYKHFNTRFSDFGLNPVAYATMTVIAHNPGARQGQVAASLGIQESNMASLVKELMGRGLLARVKSKTDRRAFGLVLTARGEELVTLMDKRARRVDREQMRALTRSERATLIGLLLKLSNADDQ